VSHPAQFRKPVDRRPHHASDRSSFSPVLWDQEDDSDSDVFGEIGVLVAISITVAAAVWNGFDDSRIAATWISCHRIPLRC